MRALRTIFRARPAAERGQAVAELAIIAPLLLLLLVGLVEFGRYARMSILVSNAARAGVQYGAQNYVTALDDAGMQNAAQTDAESVAGISATSSHYCTCADGTASSCQPTDCPSSHRLVYVQVDTRGTFTSMLHLPYVSPSLTVAGRAVMRASQ
jgi:Flp pilus assembly protein TadG